MANEPTNGGVHLPDSLILEKLDDIKDSLGGKIVDVKDSVTAFRAEVLGTEGAGRLPVAEARLNSHAVRLQKLEQWKWQVAGGLAVLAYILEKVIHAVNR